MNYTPNYNLKLPEATDNVNVEDFNYNFSNIDTALEKSTQTEAETGTDNIKIMTALRVFQAIAKWFSITAIGTLGALTNIAISPTDTVKSAIQKLQGQINNKVDKITGKGLSENDYTTSEKTKLSGIATDATKNIVEDILTSTNTVNALSANQGRALNSRIFAIESGAQKTNAFALQNVNVSNVMPTTGQVQIYDGSQYKPTSLVINISDLVSTTKTISTFENIYAYELGTLTSLIITGFASSFKDGYISFKTGTSISVSLPTGCKISGTDCSNNVFTPKTSKFYEMSFKKNNGVVFIIINGVV